MNVDIKPLSWDTFSYGWFAASPFGGIYVMLDQGSKTFRFGPGVGSLSLVPPTTGFVSPKAAMVAAEKWCEGRVLECLTVLD